MSLTNALIAVGLTRKTMISNTIGVLVNIVLDPIMIYGYMGFPKLGVEGAAWATLLSTLLISVLNYYYLARYGMPPVLAHDRAIVSRIISLGIPILLERAVFSLGNNIYIGVIARCGDAALAAHNIGVRIESLIYMPGFAFSMAASTLVGQRIGAERVEDAYRIGMEAVKASLLIMAILGVAVAATSYYVTAPFTPVDQNSGSINEEIHVLASTYLILAGLSEPGLALAMVAGGALRGAGNTRIPFIVNATCMYASRIALSIYLTRFMGVVGAWTAMFVDVYIRGLAMLAIYRKMFFKIYRRVV